VLVKRVLRRLRLDKFLPTHTPAVLSSLDAYAQWAASYPPRAHNALMELEETTMLGLMPPLEGCVVLDLACGTGRYGLIASQRGTRMVVGIDNSPDMLLLNPMQRRAQATSETLPLANNSIDVVICALALGHLREIEPSVCEISRVLKPGGIALLSDVHPFIALNGAQRTFSANGQTFAVEHYVHLYGDYQRAASDAGLVVEVVMEPRLEQAQGAPVVIVYRLRKG
jgi:malonyl-CoA O-methyltransferase